MNFKEKYIKYKNKYLKLKNLIGGSGLTGVLKMTFNFKIHIKSTNTYDTIPGGDASLNSNIIKINYNGSIFQIIISTGHSMNDSDLYKINSIEYSKKDDLNNALICDDNAYFYNFNGLIKDYCILNSKEIRSDTNKINLGSELTVIGTEKIIDSTQEYVKNGANSGITYGKLLINLKTYPSKDFILETTIKSINIYKIILEDKRILYLLYNKLTQDSYDYILYPSNNYYTKRTIDATVNPKDRFYPIIGDLKYIFPTEILSNLDTNKFLIKSCDIAQVYYDNKCFGWLSGQGDSGSGYYSIHEGTARLLGINIGGCNAIILKESDDKHEELFWDESIQKLKIDKYIIDEVYKCAGIASINTLESYMKVDTGRDITILTDF